MPKSKKPNKSADEKMTAWRKPVKLPAIAAVEPMKSLYAPDSGAAEAQAEPHVKDAAAKLKTPPFATKGDAREETIQSQEISDLTLSIPASDREKSPPTASAKQKAVVVEPILSGEQMKAETKPVKLDEKEFLRLLRTEKMDFYSLAEILRGSSMALYCVLYSESLAKGESRCQIRQNELMLRAAINNPATLYKQERWLTALHLIDKSVRLGSHNGASYEVRPLETLPLPDYILDQFGGYLAELVK